MRLKIIYIILFISHSLFAKNQYFADKLFNEGDYKRAIIEYKRVNFFNPNNYFNYRIALCYKKLGKLEEAAKIFEDLGDTGKIELIYTLIELKKYDLAKKHCKELKNLFTVELLGYIHILENEYDSAINIFDSIGLDELKNDAIYCKNLPYKKESTAILLSMLLPGAGEIYSNKLFDGIMTFSLNALTLYGIFYFAKRRQFIEMYIVLPLWNRFYIGGLQHANIATIEYNKKIKSNYLKILQKKHPQLSR